MVKDYFFKNFRGTMEKHRSMNLKVKFVLALLLLPIGAQMVKTLKLLLLLSWNK